MTDNLAVLYIYDAHVALNNAHKCQNNITDTETHDR
jgi:hypothetical protein